MAFVKFGEKKLPKAAPAVLVPRAAIRQDHGADVVFVRRDGGVEQRVVRAGAIHGEDQEVLAGLAAGEQVVIHGFEGVPR